MAMITVTALNRARCSLAPQTIASVEAGAATTVRLKNGACFDVLESVNEVLDLMASTAPAPLRPPKRAPGPPPRRNLRAPSNAVRQEGDRHGQAR
jgi:uncharacterized protein YlzI (FlbEa/FlbD family)